MLFLQFPRYQSYRNVWDPDVTSDGFRGKKTNSFRHDLSQLRSCASYRITNCTRHAGFMQKRFPNGTFAPNDPTDCSPNDQQQSRECSLQSDNTVGFFESSSWEYSWFAPHDTAHLVTLMGGNVSKHRPLKYVFSDANAGCHFIFGTCTLGDFYEATRSFF